MKLLFGILTLAMCGIAGALIALAIGPTLLEDETVTVDTTIAATSSTAAPVSPEAPSEETTTSVPEESTSTIDPNRDADGDGVIDTSDECAEDGQGSPDGCPDSDDDGVECKDDSCRQESGEGSPTGCPDDDGDEVGFSLDRCASKHGSGSPDGCPDGDDDGVEYADDDCPDEAGSTSNSGCPVSRQLEVELVEVIADSFRNCGAKVHVHNAGSDVAAGFTVLADLDWTDGQPSVYTPRDLELDGPNKIDAGETRVYEVWVGAATIPTWVLLFQGSIVLDGQVLDSFSYGREFSC